MYFHHSFEDEVVGGRRDFDVFHGIIDGVEWISIMAHHFDAADFPDAFWNSNAVKRSAAVEYAATKFFQAAWDFDAWEGCAIHKSKIANRLNVIDSKLRF